MTTLTSINVGSSADDGTGDSLRDAFTTVNANFTALNSGKAETSSLATVATTGAYSDLTGTPTTGTMASQNASAVAITGGTIAGLTSPLALDDGGTGTALSTPAGDRLLGYDSVDGAAAWISIGSNLSYNHASHTLSATGGGGGTGDVVGPASSTDNTIPRFDGAGGKTLQTSGIVIDDSDRIVSPTLKAPSDSAVTAKGSVSSGTTTFSYTDGRCQSVTVAGDVTFAFSNFPASKVSEMRLVITNGGAHTITWPGGVSWIAGSAVTLKSSGVDYVDVLYDGTTYYLQASGSTIAGTGLIAQTGPGAGEARTLQDNAGITWTDGNGVSGNPTPGISALQTLWIPAGAMSPTNANGCAALTSTSTTSGRPDVKTLNFDPSSQEYAQFEVFMPKSWDRSTIAYAIVWAHNATATNFGVVWSLQGVAVGNDDTFDVAYGTAVNVTDTGGTTADMYLSPTSSAVTIGGSPAVGDVVVFRVSRVAANGSDTLAIDAGLVGVVIYYTINTLTDA